jgi:hypothetical protein
MNEEFPNQPRAPRRSGCVGPIFAFATVFALGAGVAGFASWQLGWLRHGAMPMMSANGPTLNPMGEAQINARIAELDRKLGAIETQAALAGGQAGRAEALLVSIATRRAIERGTPLGYLEGQLRTRFGEALPQVVNSVIAFGRAPITQDRLSAQLDVLAPQLTGPDESQSTWSKVRRDLSGLFILHSETRPPRPIPNCGWTMRAFACAKGGSRMQLPTCVCCPAPRRRKAGSMMHSVMPPRCMRSMRSTHRPCSNPRAARWSGALDRTGQPAGGPGTGSAKGRGIAGGGLRRQRHRRPHRLRSRPLNAAKL